MSFEGGGGGGISIDLIWTREREPFLDHDYEITIGGHFVFHGLSHHDRMGLNTLYQLIPDTLMLSLYREIFGKSHPIHRILLKHQFCVCVCVPFFNLFILFWGLLDTYCAIRYAALTCSNECTYLISGTNESRPHGSSK